jgi:GNAT superfamily N-acetyltransferase
MTPATHTLRAARADDAAAVREICMRALQPIDLEDPDGLDRLLWHTPGVAGFVAEQGGAIVGAGFGTVAEVPIEADTPADGTADDTGTNVSGTKISGAITLLAVDPDRGRLGIGSALLQAIEDELRARGAVEVWSGGGQPRFWWPGIDADCEEAIEFFERAGYRTDDTADNMTVALADAELGRRALPGVGIRRLPVEEWPAFYAWMERTWEDPWGDEVRATLDRTPVACFVAERVVERDGERGGQREGEYLGFAAYDTNRRGWFGPMGSSPAARGSGLGGELLRSCLRDYVDQGRAECEIGWVGPAGFYTKTVGAALGRRFLRMRKDLSA